jgi:hypothetical protein
MLALGLVGDVVGQLDQHWHASVVLRLRLLLPAKDHLPVSLLLCVGESIGFGICCLSELFFGISDGFLVRLCQFLQTELPAALLLLQSILVLLLEVAVLLLAPAKDTQRGCS